MADRDSDRVAPPITPATFHILLSLEQAPAHGYHIKRLVEERTGGAVVLGAGTLYSGIRRMVKEGLIEEVDAPDAVGDVEPGTRWRFYAITPHGSGVLAAEIDRLESDLAAARAVVPRPA